MYNSYESICKAVKKIKANCETANPFLICQELGIKVVKTAMGKKTESCKGFYVTNSRIHTIVINSDLSNEFQRIICAHELGHAVMHKNRTGLHAFHDFCLFDSASTYEYEANIFAAELLLDDEDVIEKLNDDLSFFQAASELYVPAEILDFKFRTMKWKGYKMDAPLISTSTWLKNAVDCGEYDY